MVYSPASLICGGGISEKDLEELLEKQRQALDDEIEAFQNPNHETPKENSQG